MIRFACACACLMLVLPGCHETFDLGARRDASALACSAAGAACARHAECCGGVCEGARCQGDAMWDASSSLACVPTCTTHAECAASCPPNPRGASCCDTLGGICYAAMTAVCSESVPVDTGMMTSGM